MNDHPTPDAGVERLFHFLTPMGRVAIAPPPPKAGLQGGVTLDYFLESAASPALGSLIFCSSFKPIGEMRISPPSNARGALATQMIEVGNSPVEDGSNVEKSLEALVGAPDDFIAALLAAVRDGTELPAAPPEAQVKDRFWVQLEQERRPPMQNCWLLKELMPVAKTEWQRLCEQGEEFDGDDA